MNLLKVDNGYKIGLIKKEGLKIKEIKKGEERKHDEEIKKSQDKQDIGMIITGGTIASRLDTKTGAVRWLDNPESLFKVYPELFEKVNVTKVEVPFMKGSENMDSNDWKKIARVAEKFLNDSNIQGIIITHGTDSLHYT